MSTDHTHPAFDAIVEEMTATLPVKKSKMFSMPCLKTLSGKVFAGCFHGVMVFKLRNPEHAQAMALSGAHLFDPGEMGRPMKEWVVVPVEHAGTWADLAQAAFAYVNEL